MLNLASVMIGSSKPEVLGEFYEKVFQRKPDMDGDGWYGWSVGDAFLTIGPHSEIKGKSKEPPRIMFNLETDEVEDEFDRIKDLGAKIITEPYELGGGIIATFADPDGNYFQLMTPWETDMRN